MRNLFDQYDSPENRLTHALASCLAEDHRLLGRFVRWVTAGSAPDVRHLAIVEQQLPGDPELPEREADDRGLPDACIHDGESWCLVVESKVSAPLHADQLRRHRATLQRRGFEHVHVLAVTARDPDARAHDGVHRQTWTGIYKWARQEGQRSDWARRLAEYLEVAEMRMAESGYLTEGALTTFAGIPFGLDEPYHHPEAKRVLAVAMAALRRRTDLVRQLGIDPQAPGRSAIRGEKRGSTAWDVLQFACAGTDSHFYTRPHATLGIGRDEAGAFIVLPHSMNKGFRDRLRDLGDSEFVAIMQEITKRMLRGLRRAKGFVPRLELLQRHFLNRSDSVDDACLKFDLRTALQLESATARDGVRFEPEWMQAVPRVLRRKQSNSNLQLMVGAWFPYDRCEAIRKPEALDHIAAAWIACKPMLNFVLGKDAPKR